jgi:hypothetical protein
MRTISESAVRKSFRLLGESSAWSELMKCDELVWIGIGEGLEQNAVYHGKYSGVYTDAEASVSNAMAVNKEVRRSV